MLKDPLHAGREAAFPMIPDQRATPAKQMCETGLMDCVLEPPIWRPAVAHEDACEVGADQGRGFGKPTSGLNRVDRGVGRRRRP
jgi:hypothetical protein